MDEALRLAELWLDPVTDLPATGLIGRAWSRAEWVEETLGTWKRLTEPVANSIAIRPLHRPDRADARGNEVHDGRRLLHAAEHGRRASSACSWARPIGALAEEVVSSTDIGVPLADLQMALLPANVAELRRGPDLPEQDIRLFLAVREAAHARLFVQVPWLRGHLLGAIEAYARGIHIDMSRIEELARDLDPSNPEGIQEALSQGVFMPQRTPEQDAGPGEAGDRPGPGGGLGGRAHRRSHREVLPSAAALRETVRRRRATGGPAEHAFASLVGLELRPRRLREAAALWSTLKDQRGIAGRDAIWQHPDLLPTAEDLDDPAGFGDRRQLLEASESEVDAALEKLLAGDYETEGPHGPESEGGADGGLERRFDGGEADDDDGDDGDDGPGRNPDDPAGDSGTPGPA